MASRSGKSANHEAPNATHDSTRAHPAPRLATERLTLVAGRLEMARAESRDRGALAALLGVPAPENWPPPLNDEGSQAWFLRSLESDYLVGPGVEPGTLRYERPRDTNG